MPWPIHDGDGNAFVVRPSRAALVGATAVLVGGAATLATGPSDGDAQLVGAGAVATALLWVLGLYTGWLRPRLATDSGYSLSRAAQQGLVTGAGILTFDLVPGSRLSEASPHRFVLALTCVVGEILLLMLVFGGVRTWRRGSHRA